MIEISKVIDCSLTSLQRCMSRLLKDKSENVQKRILNSEEKQEKYGKRIGCRVFVYWSPPE